MGESGLGTAQPRSLRIRDDRDRARLSTGNGARDRQGIGGDHRPNVGADHDDGEPGSLQVLLIPEILVCGDEHLETGALNRSQQFAVLQRLPAAFVGPYDHMRGEDTDDRARDAMVKQDAAHVPP